MQHSAQKKHILLLNSPRSGGPLRWSRDLAREINSNGVFSARLITSPAALLAGHFFVRGDLIHTAIPILFHTWKKPLVLTVKGDYTIEKTIWRYLYPRAVRSANVVTVPSDYLRGRIQLLRDAVVIPNAVDLAQFPQLHQEEKESLECVVVTNFWFPEKARGVRALFAILENVQERSGMPPFHLTVVGGGKYIHAIRREPFARKNDVSFPGWSDPRAYLHTADVFLYYSFHDNMPNAVLEAMGMGLPVVTNNVGAIPEMIISGKDGLIAANDGDYGEKVQQLLMNYELRRELGSNARTTVKQRFNWSTVIRAYVKLYNTLLK
jgi:glycosyltransferase involved in cell wall biosynthesis